MHNQSFKVRNTTFVFWRYNMIPDITIAVVTIKNTQM